MSDTLAAARGIGEEVKALRRAFHRAPELGNREFLTAGRVEEVLRGLGIPTRRLTETAVMGVLRGGRPGPTVAIRADMDALPLQEATGAAFASGTPGVMHACGHDVHMAAALGAAMLLCERRETLPGAVVFLFQPDEEGDGGARRMIEAGALEGVDAVFGCHVSPDLPLGHVGVRYGKFYAASDTFEVRLAGRSAHGATREKGVDALGAAAELAQRLIALPEALPGERAVVSVGTLHAGTAINVLADRADLTGIIRTLGPQARQRMRGLFSRAVEAVDRAWGTASDARLHESYPGVVNDEAMTALAFGAASDLLGAARVHVLEAPTMTTEDFGYFLQVCPGSFWHIGAGCSLPLHSSGFLPGEEAAVVAAAVHARIAEAYLGAGSL